MCFVTDSVTVSVDNTIPNVDSVSLDPTVLYTNDVVTVNATFSDMDSSQNVTGVYEWHVIDANGDSVVQTGLDNTLSGTSYFDRDNEVYVVVTPNDGIDDGVGKSFPALSCMRLGFALFHTQCGIE